MFLCLNNPKINNMKKFLFMGALAAMLLGTASCSNDMEPAMGDNTVQFTIELPGAIDSRAIADGTTATQLTVAVYDKDGKHLDLDKNVTMNNKRATVTFQLVKGQQYSFAFWAQAEGAPYTFNTATATMTVNNYTSDCNDEKRDAFYAYRADLTITGPLTETVYLHRPFAQLHFGASDVAAAAAAGVVAVKSYVEVKQVSTKFDLRSGTASNATDDLVDATFAMATIPPATEKLTVEETQYDWMAMNYFLVPNNEATIETTLKLYVANTDAENPVRDITVSNVPVQKNHRTNIVGNLFTEDVNFIINIDEEFDKPDNNILWPIIKIDNTMEFYDIYSKIATTSGTYVLDSDLDIDWSLIVLDGVNVVLDLNGHTIKNSNDIYGDNGYGLFSVYGGNLTIKGNGKLIAKENDCFAVDIWDGGNLTIENGEFNGNVHCIYVGEGHAKINGGTFNIQQLSTQGIGTTGINGKEYNGYDFELNLLDKNGKNGTASIEVTGGRFYKFDPSNNLAENPQVNFVANGYVSVQDGDWYEVSKAE